MSDHHLPGAGDPLADTPNRRKNIPGGTPYYYKKKDVWLRPTLPHLAVRDRQGVPVKGEHNRAKALACWADTVHRQEGPGAVEETRKLFEGWVHFLRRQGADEVAVVGYEAAFAAFVAHCRAIGAR